MKSLTIKISFLVSLMFMLSCSKQDDDALLPRGNTENEVFITYVFQGKKYVESQENVLNNKIESDVVENLLNSGENLTVYIDPEVDNQYHLFTSHKQIEKYAPFLRTTGACSRKSTLKAQLFPDKNFGNRYQRVDIHFDSYPAVQDYSLATVYNDEDEVVDFTDKLSSLILFRGNNYGCGIFHITFTDTDVITPTLENKKTIQFRFGASNTANTISLPDFALFKFDNKADRITSEFFD